MAKPLLDDDLWILVAPLLPVKPARRFKYPGRKPVDDRLALTGILFVLKSGIPWEMLPAELGCSGMTCWRRLRVRYEKRAELHEAFLALGCCLICHRALQKSFC